MKSIKPGRGPSTLGTAAGIFAVLFGIVWTVIAGSMAPFMAIFGVLWTAFAIVITVYNYKNATQKNRYSTFDIVTDDEEPDPLNEKFGEKKEMSDNEPDGETRYCPFCGTKAEDGYLYCRSCGKKLP